MTNRPYKSYHSVSLVASPALVLEHLELLFGQPIPHLSEIDEYREDTIFGFVAEDNRVIALALENQGLTTLLNTIGQLTNLQKLYLYNNRLQTLPDTFGQLTPLQELELAYNQLQLLPGTISRLQHLRSLNLRETPLKLFNLSVLVQLAQNNSNLRYVLPASLTEHPLVQDLTVISGLTSFTFLLDNLCPLCGKKALVQEKAEETGQKRVFCANCENSIS
ncbi:MAG: leucine-rich repeat domain-containing protein [Candidatus Hermodarchaeota archaeon]